MLNALKRTLAGLGLAGLPLVAAAQDKKGAEPPPQWVETRFHRIHLKNGNFVDGTLVRKDPRTVVLKMNPGDFAIRTDMIARVEYVKMRGLQEAPKLEEIKKEVHSEGPPAVAGARRPDGAPAPSVVSLDAPADLAQKLAAESPERRRASLKELMDAKGDQGPAFVAALLERVPADARVDIVALLIEREAKSALPVLYQLLRNTDPGVRENVLRALHGIGNADTIDKIGFCLSDPDALVRCAAIVVYEKLGSAADFPTVVDKLRDSDPSVRGAVLSTLQSMAARLDLKREFREAMRSEIDSAQPETAAAMVALLGKLNDKELVPDLVRFAENDDALVRAQAIVAIVVTDPTEAAKVIQARILEEKEYQPRIQLAEGARKLRLRAVAETLVDWIADEDDNIKSAALSALKAISGQNYGTDHERWLNWLEGTKQK